ncbi:MAG: DUF4079 family protein [Deltaproteobacteria bacterium]|nr:DUF4079 family protein [Candidatus Anaeroferrophillus wilburensis]MBN2887921.1 DUF4079 family protein [Deltaproteobacteria bacterium]
MLWFHPAMQVPTIFLSLYVLYLGFQRFQAQHLKRRRPFAWQRHVLLGKVVICLWLLGMIGGFLMVHYTWHAFFITGDHARNAVLMLPLMLIGYATGWYMDRHKKRHPRLALVHGINNLLLVMLACSQIFEGGIVCMRYILGR